MNTPQTEQITKLAQQWAMDSIFNTRPEEDDDWEQVCARDNDEYTNYIDGFILSDSYEGYSDSYIHDAVMEQYDAYLQFAIIVLRTCNGQ